MTQAQIRWDAQSVEARFIAPHRHQPHKKPIDICRGEGGEEWRGGPLWSPAMPVAGDQWITEGKRATRQGNGGQP